MLALLVLAQPLLADPLSAGTITTSVNPPTVSPGQPITLTANPSGGTGVYTYQWYVYTSPRTLGSAFSCSPSPGILISGTTPLSLPSYQVAPTTSTYYCYMVTDSAGNTAIQPNPYLVTVGSGVPTVQFITQYSEFQSWLPIVFLSLLLSVTVVSVYYILGVVLHNTRVKTRAMQELGQSIGTGIVVIGIILVLTFFGTGIFAQVPAISPTALAAICGTNNAQLSGSQIDFLKPYGSFGSSPTPTSLVCTEVGNMAGSSPSITDSIDYGLFATYIILANQTNQMLNNYNALYQFEGWLGFAESFTSVTDLCYPFSCVYPVGPPGTRILDQQTTYKPLAGYDAVQKASQAIEVQAALTFYVNFMQLVFLVLVMYLWPWVLAAGVILRTFVFTRRAGGVLIAICLAFLLIYPTVFTFEYSAFQNQGQGAIYGGALPSSPIYEQPLKTGAPVQVYGAPETGGYVLASQVSNSGCAAGQYVYENVCGYGGTVSDPSVNSKCANAVDAHPQCTPPSLQSGFVLASQVPSSGCAQGQYMFENLCGVPRSATGTCVNPSYNNQVQIGPEPICTPSININFFVLPNSTQVINYYGCLPGNVELAEAAFATWYLSPFPFGITAAVLSGLGGFVSQIPATPRNLGMGWGCVPDNTLATVLALADVYGVMAVAAYLLPLLNLIIVFSAVTGISGLLGGDTNILGLGKLL